MDKLVILSDSIPSLIARWTLQNFIKGIKSECKLYIPVSCTLSSLCAFNFPGLSCSCFLLSYLVIYYKYIIHRIVFSMNVRALYSSIQTMYILLSILFFANLATYLFCWWYFNGANIELTPSSHFFPSRATLR